MKIDINYANDVVAIPAAAAARLGSMSENDMRVLISLCSDKSLRCEHDECVKSLCDRLNLSETEAENCLAALRALGALTGSGRASRVQPASVAPGKKSSAVTAVMPSSLTEYTGEQAAKIIESAPVFRTVIDETQRIIGTVFTPTEISRVIGLVDYLKLDIDYIVLLFNHCKGKGKSSVQYAVKMAYDLYNRGVDNYIALEEYINETERYNDFASRVRKVFGIHDRSFTAREKEMINAWSERNIPDELLVRAYEITVDNTSKASLAYCNRILCAWSDAGYKTVADVDAASEKYREDKQNENSSFVADEFFEAALRRGREKMGEK